MTNYDKATGSLGTGTLRIALTYSQSSSTDQTTFSVSFQIISSSGATFTNDVGWSANSAGQANSGTFDISGATTKTLWSDTAVFSHDSNGNLSAKTFSMHMNSTGTQGLGGPTDHSVSITAPRIAEAPGAPGGPTFTNLTPTGVKLTWAAAARGHANITNYAWQIGTTSSFGTVVASGSAGTALTATASTGMVPGTTYYARVRATSSDGTGSYSSVTSFKTLPATPPTLVSVTPDATGKSATLTMTPPTGISSVTSWNILRRTLPGGTFAVVTSGSANPSQTVTGLTPGANYEWKVQAVIGTYTSPDSNVISLTQPQPNTSPGAYFDGDTADVAGQTNYQWGTAGAGAAGASVSTAQSLTGAVVGWLTGAQATAISGGQAVQYQVPGGLVLEGGPNAAQYAMTVPATLNGFRAGTNGAAAGGYATVTEGGQYMGSIYVEANKARDLAAMWVWYNAAGSGIGTSIGGPVTVVKDQITRLTVLGSAPATAVRGAVVVTDPPGSLLMDAGDTLIVDAAMGSVGVLYPYFDGATLDTTLYDYEWDTVAVPVSNSPSHRLDIPQADQDPLRDPNCDPIPNPPTPPVMVDDCIAVETLWRRTWYEVDATSVPAHLAAVPTIRLSTFGYEETQVRIRWYLNPENEAPLDFDSSVWVYEQIISYIPPCSTVTIDGVSHRVWAVVGDVTAPNTPQAVCLPGDYPTLSADRLLYGTGGVPADWPVLSCGEGWLVSLDTPLGETASPAGNLVPDMSLTIRE